MSVPVPAAVPAPAPTLGGGPVTTLAYLGPEGSFTHQAATGWSSDETTLVPLRTVPEVFAAVASGEASHGVVAIESSVEGYVVPSLDAIVSAPEVVAVDEAFVSITFDAFVVPGTDEPPQQATAHPHGLAQCQGFVDRHGLLPVPASSNAAACRDIQPGQVALGPPLCGELYGLTTWEQGVEDFAGARTRFLLLTRRDAVSPRQDEVAATWRSMLAVTPHLTGPGVLARITAAFGARGVNLSSLITRPVKALEGRYVFILTVDAAPWSGDLHEVLRGLLDAGDSVKTLGVFPSRGELDRTVDIDRVPAGSVRSGSTPADLDRGLLWGDEGREVDRGGEPRAEATRAGEPRGDEALRETRGGEVDAS